MKIIKTIGIISISLLMCSCGNNDTVTTNEKVDSSTNFESIHVENNTTNNQNFSDSDQNFSDTLSKNEDELLAEIRENDADYQALEEIKNNSDIDPYSYVEAICYIVNPLKGKNYLDRYVGNKISKEYLEALKEKCGTNNDIGESEPSYYMHNIMVFKDNKNYTETLDSMNDTDTYEAIYIIYKGNGEFEFEYDDRDYVTKEEWVDGLQQQLENFTLGLIAKDYDKDNKVITYEDQNSITYKVYLDSDNKIMNIEEEK